MNRSRGRLVVGLMSGTSADGIDAVLAEIHERGTGLKAAIRTHIHRPFSASLRARILNACLHGTVGEICELNFELGTSFGKAAIAVMRHAAVDAAAVYAIGSHGQTIHHLPNARVPSTLQIGEPSIVAELTGVTTVADFRVRDMAAGGQGAPLVPYADFALFSDARIPRIVQNIGGIANLTFLAAGGDLGSVMAFDTGPGNMVIDAVMAHLTSGARGFDRGGKWAARGRVQEAIVSEAMRHPYIRRGLPKTTGREEFGEKFVRWLIGRGRRARLSHQDLVATATAFTAASISEAYRRFVFPLLLGPELTTLEVVVGGGGAYNPTLLKMLQTELPQVRLLTHEDFGIDNLAKEALAFAILAHETLRGRPSNVPSATGARAPVVLGKIVPGPTGPSNRARRPSSG